MGSAMLMHNFHRNVEAPADFTSEMAITNSAPHEFDVARFILGGKYTAVSAFRPSGIHASRTGGPVFMVLETDQGQLVNIEVNNNANYGYDVRAELVCEKGTVSLVGPVQARYDIALTSQERYPADWRPRFAEAYRLQNRDFVKFVQTGRFSETASDAFDGYCTAVVAEAAVESLATGKRTAIKIPEAPALYRRERR
jgi:myo-inositol 2-dehydrogenase/D-chiro-inositol 1-dehydrogenase